MVNYCMKLIGKGILGASLIFGIFSSGDYLKERVCSRVKMHYEGSECRFFNRNSSWSQGNKDNRDYIQRRIDEKNRLRKNEGWKKVPNLDDSFNDGVRLDV